MNYLNIISKKEIIAMPDWIIFLLCGLAIAAVLSSLVYGAIVKDMHKTTTYEFIVGYSAIGFLLIGFIICNIFFRVPTGRYKYEATIDKEKITVQQYEDFIEEYNPIIENGVYYWTD